MNEILIRKCYQTAKEFIKQNKPKEARRYVLQILNEAVKHKPNSVISKIKTETFKEKWLAVSVELREKGITDYVLECFKIQKTNSASKQTTSNSDIVSMEGLIEEPTEQTKSQGWCSDVYNTNKNAVVEILSSSEDEDGCGTGFIISQNGYLLTNHHVVYNKSGKCFYSDIKMSFSGSDKQHRLEVVCADRKADVALCRFEPNKVGGFSCVKRISDYSKTLQGADCVVLGNAFGMGIAPINGSIRFVKNNEGDLVFSAPTNNGDSGGPVFNNRGECIGIHKSQTKRIDGYYADSYRNATPMDKIDELLKKWAKEYGVNL